MKHYIIVKFVEGTDVNALVGPVKAIYDETLSIPGVHSEHVCTAPDIILGRKKSQGKRAVVIGSGISPWRARRYPGSRRRWNTHSRCRSG